MNVIKEKLGKNNLSPMWIAHNLKKEKKALAKLRNAYISLSDKSTDYACGIYRLITIREKIVNIWKINE